MLNLLIADDEEIVRSAIKSMVSRGPLTLGAIAEAGSGEEAVSLARQMRPKIILMDVKMPGLNGLEAARTIRNELPSVKIVMLTAYDEFAFVQEALRLGASDYLLKPIRPATLFEVLARVHAQIEQEEKHKIETEQLSTRLKDSLPLVEGRLVYDLVHGVASIETAADLIVNHLGKTIAQPVVLLVDIDHFNATVQSMEAERHDRLCRLLLDIVRRAIPAPERSLVGQIQPGIIAIILFCNSRDELRAAGHTIRHAIESGAPVTATVGIGHPCDDLSQIPLSYSEARHAVWYKFHFGRNSVISIDDVQRVSRSPRPYPVDMEQELITCIRLGRHQAGADLLNQIAGFILEKLTDPPDVIRTRFMELMVLISRAIIDAGAPVAETLGCLHRQLAALEALKTASEVRDWASESLALMTSRLPGGDRGNQTVEQAIQLMRERLHQSDLKLKDIADLVYVSPSHLAHLLKEKTGHTFVRHITLLRVEEAKKLLATSDMTIAAVALAVGYENPAYFHRVFRREVAMTPATYRRWARSQRAHPASSQPAP